MSLLWIQFLLRHVNVPWNDHPGLRADKFIEPSTCPDNLGTTRQFIDGTLRSEPIERASCYINCYILYQLKYVKNIIFFLLNFIYFLPSRVGFVEAYWCWSCTTRIVTAILSFLIWGFFKFIYVFLKYLTK